MVLNFEEIKSITLGAERIEKDCSAIKFYRFTKEEQEIYSKTVFYEKTFSTAGVQMQFETDGESLYLKASTKSASSRTFFSMDIFVNGNIAGSFTNFEKEDCDGNYTEKTFALGTFSRKIELGAGQKRVKIVFPWSVSLQLEEMQLENATYITPIKKKKKMLAYGDSITHGYDAIYTSNAYVTRIAEAFDFELYNKAIGGEIFFPELSTVKSVNSPDCILVAYGTNEWGGSEQSDFKTRCRAFFGNLVKNYPETPIFALTPIWRADWDGERKFGGFFEVEKILEEICAEYENIKTISGWRFVPQDKKYFADLRLHPNDNGFKAYAENLKKEMKKYMPCRLPE